MSAGAISALFRVRPGYSLLEVIVVVAILGVAATVSGPSITRMIASQQARQVVRGLATDFGALRAQAFINSRSYDADAIQSVLSEDTPEFWQVIVQDSVSLSGNGYCTPGTIDIRSPSGRAWAVQVSEGACELTGLNGV